MTSNKGLSNYILISILIWLTVPTWAQSTRNCEYIRPHQADHWVFGIKGGIDFTQTPPQATPTAEEYKVINGISAYSNEDGILKAFSNGQDVRNGSYYIMSNGQGLKGAPLATMNSIIVPNPGNVNQLFIFTTGPYIEVASAGDGVFYSTIDYSSSASGVIINKNTPLFTKNSVRVCAVKHENQRDYWVIFHGMGASNGDSFFSYLVDTGGVSSSPIVSKVGYIQQGDYSNGFGYMKASSDGNKIAHTIWGDGIVEVLSFNKSTGIISNPISSNPGDIDSPDGLEFSPDNNTLYVSTQPLPTPTVPIVTDYLYQFDLTSSMPFSTPFTEIEHFNSSNSASDSLMGGLQLSPDGKIFLTIFNVSSNTGKPTLSVIYNPNRAGAACNYNNLGHVADTRFNLNGGESLLGLPTFVTDYLNIPHFSFFNKCKNDVTDFQIRNTANVEATWNFSTIDPNGVLEYGAPDLLNPGFKFSDAGTYQVELTETWNGVSIPYSREVIIHPLPVIDIGNGADTISILPNSSIQLDAGEWDYIEWSPGGSHDRYLDVNQEGKYKVTVVDTNCCYNVDEVYIMFAELSFPNAFNPNSNIASNQSFGVIGDVASLSSFIMQIYDRWGQIIFETTDPKQKWDGKFKSGEMAPYGVYVWHSVFTTFDSGFSPARDIDNRGTVTLLR